MTTFSPGPWSAGHKKGHPWHVDTLDGRIMVFGTAMRGTKEQQAANAYLFAAALELLAALEATQAAIDKLPEGTQRILLNKTTANLAAIAKAKGKTS